MTTLGQLLKELKARNLIKAEEKVNVNPIMFAMEESMKKRLNRNKYKVQREFQSLKNSINKHLRELGAPTDPSDCGGEVSQRETNNNLSTSLNLKKPFSQQSLKARSMKRNTALTQTNTKKLDSN